MTGTTPLPTPPSASRPSTLETDTDAFLSALPLFQTELNAIAASLSPLGRNMLINPAFQIDQVNLGASTATSDDIYCFDQWYALTQTASVAASQLTAPEDGYTNALRLTQSQASAQRFGFAQIIQGVNCKQARGGSGTLAPRIRCSASTPIRYAILGWTGTEDAVTSDVVLSWTSGTFTGGNFFNSTTLSVLGVGAVTPSANTWTPLTALTATLGSTFNNIIIMIWTETAQAQNVTLDADYVQFEAGATANPAERRQYAQELVNCLPYCQALEYAAGGIILVGQAYSANDANGSFTFPKMFAAPTISAPAAGSGSGTICFQKADGSLPGTVGTHTFGAISKNTVRVTANGYTAMFTAGNATVLAMNTVAGRIILTARL